MKTRSTKRYVYATSSISSFNSNSSKKPRPSSSSKPARRKLESGGTPVYSSNASNSTFTANKQKSSKHTTSGVEKEEKEDISESSSSVTSPTANAAATVPKVLCPNCGDNHIPVDETYCGACGAPRVAGNESSMQREETNRIRSPQTPVRGLRGRPHVTVSPPPLPTASNTSIGNTGGTTTAASPLTVFEVLRHLDCHITVAKRAASSQAAVPSSRATPSASTTSSSKLQQSSSLVTLSATSFGRLESLLGSEKFSEFLSLLTLCEVRLHQHQHQHQRQPSNLRVPVAAGKQKGPSSSSSSQGEEDSSTEIAAGSQHASAPSQTAGRAGVNFLLGEFMEALAAICGK